jgi:hypothetical protein
MNIESFDSAFWSGAMLFLSYALARGGVAVIALILGGAAVYAGVRAKTVPRVWLPMALLALAMVAYQVLMLWGPIHHAQAADAERRAVEIARHDVAQAQNLDRVALWATHLDDLALAISGERLTQSLGAPPNGSVHALWDNTVCTPWASRCPYGSACMQAFEDAWKHVQNGHGTWEIAADVARKRNGTAWVDIGHEARGSGPNDLCLAGYGQP